MSPFEVILSVSFLIAFWAGIRRFDKIASERKALSKRCSELETKLRKSESDSVEALNRVRDYYDREIEGQKRKTEDVIHILEQTKVFQRLTELDLEMGRAETERISSKNYIPGADAGS